MEATLLHALKHLHERVRTCVSLNLGQLVASHAHTMTARSKVTEIDRLRFSLVIRAIAVRF